MRIIFKNLIGLALLAAIIANVFLFVSSIKLSDDINKYEIETEKLRQQNLSLGKQAAWYDSIQFAASAAAGLNFVKKETPIYLDNLRFALNH